MGQRRKAALCAALLCCSMWTMRLARAQDAPDYPTIGAALLELGLTMASYFLTVANLTSLVQDPNTNAILLVPTNAGLQQAITDYQAQRTLQDMARTRLISLLMIFPQPPGTVHGALNPTDGLIMDTLLTSSTDYPGQLNTTLTRLTFRDNGDGRWYVASSPPGAIVNLSLTYTAGNARIYQLEGMIGPPSDVFKPPDVLVHIYSIAEALQDQPELSTYLTLAKADAALWPMFANGSETCTTIFPATNSAWQTYFTSIGTTLDSFKGTPAAHDLLAASIMTNRPYMVQQLPAGLTQAKDLLGRTVQMQSDGIPDPNNTVSLIGTKNPGGLSILPAPLRNIRAGKSVLQAIGDVLLPDNSTLPGVAGSVTPVAAPAAAPSDTSGSSSHKSTGVIVGLTVGITAGVALVALAAGFIMRHRRRAASKAAGNGFDWGFAEKGAAGWMQARLTADTDSVVVVGPASPGAHMDIPGVHKGMFTRMVAHEYTWTDMIPEPGQCVSVESGVNDRELDSLAQGEGAPQDCPVVKLSKEDVKEQIQLLRHGVLGKGATAMVFQCVWPSRFGPDALLAVKVLKEGSDADPHHLSSFAYEAAVLESLVHPNVVRLYGYCLEPPCVCIILELLPLSLKQLLYDTDPTAALLSSPSGMVSQGATQTRVSHHPLSGTSLSHAAVKSLLANLPPAMGQDASHNNSPDTTGSPEPPEEGKHSAHSMEAVSEAGGVKHSAHSVEVTIHEGGGDQPLTAVRKLTVLQVLSISNDIAAGLAHMHNSSHGAAALAEHCLFEEHPSCGQRARVVHRDLKPANILINSRGQAKISDFGLARQHHQTTIATAHVGAGTLPYMAPELLIHASGQGYAAASATNRVDIYSLAMIMWEMLAGHTPWQGSADAALVIAVTQGRRPPLPEPPAVEPPLEPGLLQREAGPEVVPQFNAVVRACWRQRELKRPTAVAVHHKLCQLLTDMGVPTSSQVVHAVGGHEQGQDEVSLGMPPTMSL